MSSRNRRTVRLATLVVASLGLALSPLDTGAQQVPTEGDVRLHNPAGPAGSVVGLRAPIDGGYPSFSAGREITLSTLGVGTLTVGFFLPVDTRMVPAGGLDPSGISFSFDRHVVGNRDESVVTASDWTRNAALLMPWALAALTGPDGRRWHAMGPRVGVWAETFFVSSGLALLGKASFSRPRPFAYLPAAQRPDGPAFDVTRDRAFRSLPSAHASLAWTAAGLTVTEHLMYRPEVHWAERATVGFLAGAFATATASLRVMSGQHFPTDVVAGSVLGAAAGVGVPLLHRGDAVLPGRRVVLEAVASTMVGSLFALFVTSSF